MQIAKSICLLFLMGIVLSWQYLSVCYKQYQETHEPPGHVHGLCMLRKADKGGTAFWPPLDCHDVKLDIHQYQPAGHEFSLKPTPAVIAVATVLFDLCPTLEPANVFPDTRPPPKANNPFLANLSHRGPPIV